MASSLTVPPPVVKGLSKIAALNEVAFKEFLTFLAGIPLRIRQSDIFDDSDAQIDSIPPDDFLAMKQGIFSLFVGRAVAGVSTGTFVEDLIEYLSKGKEGQWLDSKESQAALRYRLKSILEIEKLNTLAKAYDLLTENVHTFERARILSDIRPVFGETLSSPPNAGVIIHTLNISYYEAGERKEFSVALDSKDVQSLLDVLKRAGVKSPSLVAAMSSSGMDIIDVV